MKNILSECVKVPLRGEEEVCEETSGIIELDLNLDLRDEEEVGDVSDDDKIMIRGI